MRRKLLETIDHMSPEEQLTFIHSVYSLNTALMGYSPEQLQRSPEVSQLAALLMGMGQAQQCQYEDVCSQDYFPPIVNALSSTLAEHGIRFVHNPHVIEAVHTLGESVFENQQLFSGNVQKLGIAQKIVMAFVSMTAHTVKNFSYNNYFIIVKLR